MPFTTQELFQEGEALYYGLNALSNNMIMVDRKRLKNPNGLMYKAINIRMSVIKEKHLFPDRQEECKAIYVNSVIKVAKDIARSPISYAEKLKSVEEVSDV